MFWGVKRLCLRTHHPIALANPVKFRPRSQGSLPRREREPWGLVHHVKPTATLWSLVPFWCLEYHTPVAQLYLVNKLTHSAKFSTAIKFARYKGLVKTILVFFYNELECNGHADKNNNECNDNDDDSDDRHQPEMDLMHPWALVLATFSGKCSI